MDGLIDSLRDINAERFVLVSTIDVFPRLTEIDDGFRGPWTPNHPYGANRKLVEDFAQNRWEQCTVVRIPGLFGPGLKKNLIYDLMNDRLLHDIHPDGILQWYDIGRLWEDVLTVMSAGIESILLATEPVRTGEIAARFFPRLLIGSDASGPPHSDVRTIHGGLFGGRDAYRLTASEVLDDLAAFLAAEEAHPGAGR